jgi:O-antigen/teichoic acid export membrane protein
MAPPVDPVAPAVGDHAPDLLDTPQAGSVAIRGGALRLAGFAAGTLVSLASTALLLRHLGVDDTGSYVAVLSLGAVVAGLTDVGLAVLGVRELSVRTGAERAAAMRTLLGMRIVLSVVGIAGAVLFAVVVGYSPQLIAGTAIAGLGILVQGIQIQFATSLQSRMRLGALTLVDFGRQACSALLIALGVLVGAGLLSFVAVTVAAGLAAAIATVALVARDVPLRPGFDPAAWRALLRQMGAYSLAVAAQVLYLRAAIVVVSIVGTATELGIFSAAYRIVDVAVALPVLVVGAAFPILARAARDDSSRLGYAVTRLFEVALVLGVLLALTLSLGAELAIEIVAGPDFEDSVAVLQIQSAVLATTFVGAVCGYALLALGLYRQTLRINSIALAIGVVLVVVLTGPYGATGAAAATVAGELVLIALCIWTLARHDAALAPSWRPLPKVALAAGLAVAPTVLLGLPAAAAAASGAVIYSALVLAFGLIPEELFAELRRRRG